MINHFSWGRSLGLTENFLFHQINSLFGSIISLFA